MDQIKEDQLPTTPDKPDYTIDFNKLLDDDDGELEGLTYDEIQERHYIEIQEEKVDKIAYLAIEKIVKGEQESLTLNDLKAVALHYLEELNYYNNSRLDNKDRKVLSFWYDVDVSNAPEERVRYPDALRQEPNGLDYGVETLSGLLRKKVKALPSEQRVAFCTWFASHLDETQFLFHQDDSLWDGTDWSLRLVDFEKDDTRELVKQIWNYLEECLFYKHTNDYDDYLMGYFRQSIDRVPSIQKAFQSFIATQTFSKKALFQDFLNESFFRATYFIEDVNNYREYVKAEQKLLQKEEKDEADKENISVDDRSEEDFYQDEYMFHDSHEVYGEKREEDEIREHIQFLESIIQERLGLPEWAKIYAELSDLYRDIDFDKYPTNIESINERIVWLKEMLKGREGDVIVDLGCGTGDTVLELLKAGFKYIYGIDVSDKNIEVAREKLMSNHPDDFEKRFIQGDWNHLPFEDESLDVLICLGRSLPHTEDPVTFNKVLREIHRVLKPGGTFIFDMPNPDKGAYSENKKKYQEVINKHHEHYQNIDTHYMQYVVDSPDGKAFYNRYVPDEETIRLHLDLNGFEVIEELRSNSTIPGWDGSENMQFVCRKK